ncbi:cilia- and flagella-associated protein 44 isoform X1 [Diorhabda sublineata]|uniref:cilia- and flagella-associated protein 44 isoform X1 n=1 Tax=Diorhabda sublineata TaxID=1163346 RepID=UPI0024E0CA85|nr:cilia- and flagella-associated protein 44 isoform X1 [Diorhabda sublineata]
MTDSDKEKVVPEEEKEEVVTNLEDTQTANETDEVSNEQTNNKDEEKRENEDSGDKNDENEEKPVHIDDETVTGGAEDQQKEDLTTEDKKEIAEDQSPSEQEAKTDAEVEKENIEQSPVEQEIETDTEANKEDLEQSPVEQEIETDAEVNKEDLEQSPVEQEIETDAEVNKEDLEQSTLEQEAEIDKENIEQSPVEQETEKDAEVDRENITEEAEKEILTKDIREDVDEIEELEEIEETKEDETITDSASKENVVEEITIETKRFSRAARKSILTEISVTDSIEEEEVSDEENVEEEEEIEEEEEPEYYDPDDFLSGPTICEGGSLPLNIIQFYHSFGYNCRKRFNLEVLDDDTVVFASGNFLHFFNLQTREIWFRRSALGQGIGHIKKNPNKEYPHFAVAECGQKPIIILYNWPEMTILCVLKGGAKRLYSHMDYSPDGEFLVSQSGEPDYIITVWNWHEHKILLRNKSYVNDVYQIKFSPYIPGQITTCGVAHIKFWKMARTFTGLKLQGEVGRFGKTEYSDIIGILPMPDEKVVSGCDWGNILIWDGGLISLEVYRTLRKRCHDGPIVQIFYEEGELWTVSLDGHVRIWWYEKIDQADPPDSDRVILLDPSYDFYTEGMSLYQVIKRREEGSMFIAQDGNGGIWQIDLNTLTEPEPSTQFYKCHAGKVVDIGAYSYGPYLASLGKDGRIYVYNYLDKKMVFHYEFPAKGARMIWPTTDQISSGDVILAGFCDGQIRVCVLNLKNEKNITLTVTQVIKPHNKPITSLVMNSKSNVVVSGGEDMTIFVFSVNTINEMSNFLVPIGFVPTPDSVTYLTWKPQTDYVILVGCLHGQLMEVEVPHQPQDYTEVSFLLKTQPKFKNFQSYKSQIRRNIHLKKVAKKKAKKVELKKVEMQRILKENPGLEIDEEVFLADSEPEEELEPLYFPEERSRILWMRYTPEKTIWLSMSGYDAGYIYEYKMDQSDNIPFRYKMVYEADDVEISSYVYDEQRKYLIFAMQDGSIRINRVNPRNFRDLKDYYTYSLHDNQYGFIPRMCFSWDEKFFFTCGHDGNVFVMQFNHEHYMPPLVLKPLMRMAPIIPTKDLDPYVKLSLEDTKIHAEDERIMKAANEHKAHVRETLKGLKERYAKILARNHKLLPSQHIPREKLELDERVLNYIEDDFQSKLDLIHRKFAYDFEKSKLQMKKLLKYFTDPCDMHPVKIYGINSPSTYLLTIRQRIMSSMFPIVMKMCEDRIEEEKNKEKDNNRIIRVPERTQPVVKFQAQKQTKSMALEYFLLSLTSSQIEQKLGPKLTRLLHKYRQRRNKWDQRAQQWEEFNAKKPDPAKNHPDDEKFLQEAMQNIGDYKLKEADNYKPLPEERETTIKKYKQVLDTRLKQYNIRHKFIKRVYDLRDLKYKTIEQLKVYREELLDIHLELPHNLHRFGPDIPEKNPDEFPEEKLTPQIIIEETEESITTTNTIDYVPQPTVGARERYILPNRNIYPKMNNNIFVPSHPLSDIEYVITADFNELLNNYPVDVDTPFESELRAKRLTRVLFNQSLIISKMNKAIADFNYEIEEGKKARLPVHPQGNFVDIFILTLNQELNILKKFEDGEDYLQNKVNKCLLHVHNMEDEIDEEKSKKIDIENEIDLNHQEEQKIQEKFKHVTETSKYYDFLRKVFRKKYRPPKQTTDSDSDSESSSSSSEESEDDDGASIDSRDFGFIKQDLNVCPKGCEQAIFNLTVELRGKRHVIEQNIKELQRVIETINKNVELSNRKMRILQNQYKQSVDELEAYQREKQRLLNQVRCTVVLNLDQIHDYNPETDEISDYLVFSKSTLSDLYKRVGGLEAENLDQKAKYETYLKHLTRMKKDLRYMRLKIKNLLQTIQQMMCEKFGKIVDINELELAIIRKTFNKSHINELEEVVLKKLVFDVRLKNTNIKEIYAEQLREMTLKIRSRQEDLMREIKENTNRLELLQIMNKEKKDLVKLIASQPLRRMRLEKTMQTSSEYDKDIKKLQAIVDNQNRTIFELKADIKMLKTKGMPPKEQYIEPQILEDVEKSVESIKEWPEIEKYLETTQEDEEGEEETEEEVEEKLLEEEEQPGFFLTESEDIVNHLLNEILRTMKMRSRSAIDAELISKNILSHILNCTSVQDIIKEIINSIPFELSPKQRSLVETSAEKLYLIQEPDMSEDSIIKYANELLEDTIDEVLQKENEPYDVVGELLERLIESIPKEFLFHESSVESIVDKIGGYINGHELDKERLTNKIESLTSVHKNEILAILDAILKKVYGTGIDYMYVIKNK